jgi:cytochrome c556
MTDTDKNYDSTKPSSPEVKSEPSKPTRIKFDGGRAAELLAIVQGIANVAPGYTNILAEAMAELREMNEQVKVEAEKNAAAYREKLAASGKPVGAPGMPVYPESSPATSTTATPAPPPQTDEEKAKAAKAKADADAAAAKANTTFTSDTNPAYPERKI